MKTIAAILIALLLVLAGGCGKHGDGPASATISWIHPRLSQPTQPVAIADPSAVALLPSLFEGYDGPPPNVPAADPVMYDCIISMTSREGVHTDIKVYLPRPNIFPGLWRHPKGQLLYFDAKTGKQILKLVAPYIPNDLQR